MVGVLTCVASSRFDDAGDLDHMNESASGIGGALKTYFVGQTGYLADTSRISLQERIRAPLKGPYIWSS